MTAQPNDHIKTDIFDENYLNYPDPDGLLTQRL